MFGGHGIYAADDAGQRVMFALEADGEIYFKADADTQKLLEAAGSRPFVYEGSGRRVTMSYWLLPEAAHDEAEELRRWCALALAVASRAANRKTQARLGAPRRGRGKSGG
jgi:DNA transformation protein